MMRRAIPILGAAVMLWAGAAPAQEGALGACSDPALEPRTTVEVCNGALGNTRLSPEQRAGVLVNLGVAQAALGQHGTAITSFSLAIATEPSLVVAYANRARSLIAEGASDAALADFDTALQIDPTRAEVWLGRGALLLRRQAAEAAVSDLTRAIALDPSLTAARYNRGVGYLLLDRPDRAESDFSAVLRREPEDAGALLNRARAREAQGRPGVLEDFDRAVAVDPEWPRAWAFRGLHHEKAGRIEAANADFLRAYDLGFGERWLVERVQTLGRR
jgi:tetratricopeptide (TPR) repeat protein